MTTSLDQRLEERLQRLAGTAPLVMVVQPERDERAALADLLVLDGYRVVEAQNGRAALARLRSGGELPRVLLADLDAPHLSGPELLAVLRTTPVLCRVAGVLLSSRSDIERQARRLGAVAGLRKPLPERLVLQTVGWLSGRTIARP